MASAYGATSPTSKRTNSGISTNNGSPSNARTKLLLLGQRRSGKTSIKEVLFNGLGPKQTFYLESTMRIVKHPYDTVIPLEIWDCPGNATVESLGAPLSQFSALVFVIDIRDLYKQPISKLVEFIVAASHDNPQLLIEIFVHKAERLQDDDKIESFRQIQERVQDNLMERDCEQVLYNFYLTSIYDHSLNEAFSKVLHKLIYPTQLEVLERLLNSYCANCSLPKAFLFDVASRLYVATDASPVDTATHNLCCDYIQMLSSFRPLYRTPSSTAERTQTGTADPESSADAPPRFYPSAAVSLSSSSPGTTLTYHLMTPHLALLSLVPTGVYEGRRGLFEYNVVFVREGVQEICEA
ncbi:unnamed protein product [Mycena citricolor]|uniref:GTP-binding protein n=2 Tax=Mycena citricolor TaxID=2018698 RepID=A0AAD2H7E3_9AGAR|nr:unnamed protein product [Mycena citricolor]